MVVVWKAGIDESGIHDNSPFVVVSTVLGNMDAWGSIMPKWREVLNEVGVPYYHSVDFNGGRKVAKNLTKKERDDCFIKLSKIMGDVELEYISYIVNRNIFNKVSKRYPKNKLSVYDYLLASNIRDIQIRLDHEKAQTKIDDLRGLVMIEAGCQHTTNLCDILQKATKRRFGIVSPIVNMSYVDKTYIPVQVADIIAYDTYKTVRSGNIDYQKQILNVPNMRISFEKITKGNIFRPFIIDESWLNMDIPVAIKFCEELKKK